MPFLRGFFVLGPNPLFCKFTVLPLGMLKAVEAAETSYSLVFSVFAGIAFF